MTDQLKNRLVGALVLIVLAVIFLPNILDGQKQVQEQEFKTIPLRPDFDVSAVVVTQPDSVQSPLEEGPTTAPVSESPSEPAPVDAVSATEPAAKPRNAVDSRAANREVFNGNAWVVRMGGFNNADNVKALVAKLRQQGFKCYTLPSTPKNGSLTRVFVGPSLDRQALESQLPALKALTNLSGSIVKYQPTAS